MGCRWIELPDRTPFISPCKPYSLPGTEQDRKGSLPAVPASLSFIPYSKSCYRFSFKDHETPWAKARSVISELTQLIIRHYIISSILQDSFSIHDRKYAVNVNARTRHGLRTLIYLSKGNYVFQDQLAICTGIFWPEYVSW